MLHFINEILHGHRGIVDELLQFGIYALDEGRALERKIQ